MRCHTAAMVFVRSFALLLLLLCASCTSLVFAPERVEQPAAVFVLREALHIGLLLPEPVDAPQRWIEYGYGDWSWYALGNESWWRVFPTVLWPTAATLCRREWVARDEDDLARLVTARGCEVDRVVVERARVETLANELSAKFRDGAEVRRDELRMDFVREDGGYWMGNTCADVAAEWCKALGCEVGWVLIRGSLRTKAPPQ